MTDPNQYCSTVIVTHQVLSLLDSTSWDTLLLIGLIVSSIGGRIAWLFPIAWHIAPRLGFLTAVIYLLLHINGYYADINTLSIWGMSYRTLLVGLISLGMWWLSLSILTLIPLLFGLPIVSRVHITLCQHRIDGRRRITLWLDDEEKSHDGF